ncbi:hypothetical protein BH11MYX3_BH11MYX3_03510 [soil metagenome]
MILPWLAVVFGGVLGNGNPEAARISTEILTTVRERAELTPIKLPAKQLAALTHHASASHEIVAKLEVDGVIAGELIDKHGELTLRIVVYAADGRLRSLSEITLRNRALGFDDFAVMRSNLTDEVVALAPKPAKPPKVAVALKPAPEPEIEIDPTPTPAAGSEVAAIDEESAPLVDEPIAVVASSELEDEDPVLGLRVALGLGVSSRSFTPGPATVAGYNASPVGTIGLSARIQPARRLCLDALVDRTLAMSTPMGADTAATSMSRWEVSGDYFLHQGRLAIASRVGLGRRAFSIETNLSGHTPDTDYNYLIVGATGSAMLGHGVVAHVLAAFEPVLWGSEPTEMAFGEARRWAIDLGAALEARPSAHVFARLAVDLQRFAWSWTAAGARGAGGAVDLFPSAMASVGATY